jgi:hypothetical protein
LQWSSDPKNLGFDKAAAARAAYWVGSNAEGDGFEAAFSQFGVWKYRSPLNENAIPTLDKAKEVCEEHYYDTFTKRVRALLQQVSRHKPARFVGTAVNTGDLARLGKFLTDLAALKRVRP